MASNIICFGASNTLGAGGVNGGWPDRLKRDLFNDYYDQNLPGSEENYVYNLSISGEPIEYLKKRAVQEIQFRQRPYRETILVFETGGNDALAKDNPDGFVNTPEAFRESLEELLRLVKPLSGKILFVGLPSNDESKTWPSVHPTSGQKIYQSNERRSMMEDIVADVCKAHGLSFVPIMKESNTDEWQQKHLWKDGQHLNEAGHQWVYEQIKPEIMKLLKGL